MKTYQVTMARQENRIVVYTVQADDQSDAESQAWELFEEENFNDMKTVVSDEWCQQVDECEDAGLSSCD
jgi:hypothetical protein